MPTVATLPTSLHTSPSLSSSVSRASGASFDDLSVAEIKDRAKTIVQQARGASATALIKTSRDKAIAGSVYERDGELKEAFGAFHIAAGLSALVFETPEMRSKSAPIFNEFVDFQQAYGNDLIPKTMKLEARLMEMERSKPSPVVNKVSNSIADRMRSLQDAGLSLQSSKRYSRDLAAHSTASDHPRSNGISRATSSQQGHSPSPSIQSTHTTTPVTSPPPTSHTFVAPSSFGPPSPTSSTASSPRLGHFNSISEISQAFPSIDELDEMAAQKFPPMPIFPSVPKSLPGDSGVSVPSPSVIARFPSFPIDLDPGPRPASTPIPQTLSTMISRPASPSQVRSPTSSSHPPKQVSLAFPSPKLPLSTSIPTTPIGERPDLPVTNSVFPQTLREFFEHRPEVKMLFLDVRDRDEFDKEHIKVGAVICLEPSVLAREGITGEKLEDSLSIAPQSEAMLFRNRNKFDLVVMYDASSDSLSPSMTAVSRAIYENEFKKILKKPPVILVGGLKAWKESYGDHGVTSSRTNGNTGTAKMDRISLPPAPNGFSRFTSIDPRDTGAFDDLTPPKEKYHAPAMSKAPTYPHVNGVNGTNNIASAPPKPTSVTSPNNTGSFGGLDMTGKFGGGKFGLEEIPEGNKALDTNSQDPTRKPLWKPRPPSSSVTTSFNGRILQDNATGTTSFNQSTFPSASGSIQYPQFARTSPPNFTSFNPNVASGAVSPPPQASINPSPSGRRRSDYLDQSEQAVSSFSARPSIDYPELSAQNVLRPPPAVATPPTERQDNRPRIVPPASFSMHSAPKPPLIQSDYPISYWPDTQVATCGLKNLGNTCYMNATLQCLSATVPFARFFTDGRWKSAVNMVNPLGTKGHLTQAFASLLHELWHEESSSMSPFTFRRSICGYGKQFAGSEQHDSQEFLNFLLDGLHEDLNRVLQKPPNEVTPEREAELEILPQQVASDQEWSIYRMRNDSIVVDFFQGQFRNRMECMTCRKTSTTYNTFMYLTLPLPTSKGSKVTLKQCLDAFVQEEVMEKSDAWNCPNCKALRKATKRLSLSRLPPILLIHLKRFSFKGPFTDKLETVVDFPIKDLDLTNYMPPPLPPGPDKRSSRPISLEDPRSQLPPYKYDLYGVTNHFGTLSSGHYTAFINSRGSWLYCDDSRVSVAESKEIVGRPAYVLFYKRSRS